MGKTQNRPRGRPRGTGKNDTPFLQQVADLIVEDPNLRKTTAIKRVLDLTHLKPGEMENTVIRRLQHKWKIEGPRLLEEARGRRAVGVPRSADTLVPTALTTSLSAAKEIFRYSDEIARILGPIPPGVRECIRLVETHRQQIQGIQEAINRSGLIQLANSLNNSGLVQLANSINQVRHNLGRLGPHAGL